ncbi:MAG TPA: flavin reductase family protein [Chloroflexota bacterium]|nr:flavin reductase family protein [Chloroflexota bacterium]
MRNEESGCPSEREAVDPLTFRRIVGQFATGVVVITTATQDGLHGLTVNAFCSVSLEPPLVLVCVDRLARGHDRIAQAGAFGISILSDRQEFLADRLAGRAPLVNARFDAAPYLVGVTGAPLLKGSIAWLDCRLWATYDGGDHSIFVGEVLAAALLDEQATPLLFHAGRYRKGF